jgi:hypothetical protein
MELPIMTISELTDRASAFAGNLATRLEDVNAKYSIADMTPEEQEIFAKTIRSMSHDQAPSHFIPVFERLFFAYMASRYVIVPDQP